MRRGQDGVFAGGPAGLAGGREPSPGGLLERVSALRAELSVTTASGALDDEARLLLLTELELLTRAAAGVSVLTQVGFAAQQVASQLEAGVAPSRAGRGIPADLAAARRTSPHRASRELTSARALATELPHTLAALRAGTIDAHQSRVVAEATVCLSADDRAEVDRRLAATLPGASTREIEATTRALVYEVDPEGFVRRARKAAADRGVSVRPLPDVMGLLSARMPAAQAIAVFKTLSDHADASRASGDPRTRNQLMADELFSRLTGRTVVDGIDVEVGVVITESALFGGTSEAADLKGYGPIPAETARDLLRPEDAPGAGPEPAAPASPPPAPESCDGPRCTTFSCPGPHGAARPPAPVSPSAAASDPSAARAATVWLRRYLADPVTGVLADLDPRRRRFTDGLRRYLVARDQTCRNAWCGAPIRHLDHKIPYRDGGTTTPGNGQGLCAACNLAREHPRQRPPSPDSYRPPPPILPTYAEGPRGP